MALEQRQRLASGGFSFVQPFQRYECSGLLGSEDSLLIRVATLEDERVASVEQLECLLGLALVELDVGERAEGQRRVARVLGQQQHVEGQSGVALSSRRV